MRDGEIWVVEKFNGKKWEGMTWYFTKSLALRTAKKFKSIGKYRVVKYARWIKAGEP